MFIQNCIFDLGAVIINIDVSLTVKAFSAFAPQNIEKIKDSILKTDLFFQFEKGLVDEDTFRNQLRELFELDLSDAQIDEAWNALLLDFPLQRIELLKNIQSRYRTFLLSNTNHLHLRALEAILHQSHQIPTLDLLFEKTYYSQHLQMRKPDAEIYEHVLHQNKLIPAETIFFDDNWDNILAARNLGMQAIHILPAQNDVTDYFKQLENGFYELQIEKL